MMRINEIETRDEIILEIRKIKEALAKSVDFDIDRMLEEARQKQKKSDRQILSPPVRKNL